MKALPKNALIEKQVLLHTGRREIEDDEGEIEVQIAHPVLCTCAISFILDKFGLGSCFSLLSFPAKTEGNGSKIYNESLKFQDGPFLCGVIFGRGFGNLGPPNCFPDRS